MGLEQLSSRAIIGVFYEHLAIDFGATWIPDISMYFTSNQESETYPWLGMSPQLRKWTGGRQAKGLRVNELTITNEEYEATVAVLTKELRRDKTGQILIRIRELATRANGHWMKLLSDLMIAMEATTCYDGQYFIDDDHVTGDSGSQSNDLSVDISELSVSAHGTTTAPSAEEFAQAILQTITAITTFKDDQGEPVNEFASKFLVMVPPSLLAPGAAATVSQIVGAGVSNIIKSLEDQFSLRLATNARLSSWTDKFVTYRTDAETKPFICQEEVPITMDAIAEGSEMEFTDKMHQYGVWTSRAVGYGEWRHACMATLI